MIITLKNIKHSDFASQETYCFEATVYVDGKRSFIASNDGHGGCDNYRPVKNMEDYRKVQDQVNQINAELSKKIVSEYKLKNSLELVVGELITNWLIDKQVKRTLKKICYMDGEQMYTINHKPTSQAVKFVKEKPQWKPEYILLNELPIEEVRQYFR